MIGINTMVKVITLITIPVLLIAHSVYSQSWEEIKSDHFIIYFETEPYFAKDIARKAESDYHRIANDLGYARHSDFWLWDNRVKIYIYPNHKSFIRATGQPEWSHGVADYGRKEIISYTWGKDFLESLLPHEIAHLIFRDFVGFKGEIPLWLDEGVAQWSEYGKRSRMKKMVRQLYEHDTLLALKDMMSLEVRRIRDMEKVHMHLTHTKKGEDSVLFLSTKNLINTYYLQSFSIIGFLIEKYGNQRFTNFCRELRDGKPVESALRSAYPVSLQDIDVLEDRWRDYLSED
jgi:hypothetical protein